MGGVSVQRRAEMYAMINSIENDLVQSLTEKLILNDIDISLVQRSVCKDKADLESILRGLDLQGYIEIINNNPAKLGMKKDEKDFINCHFCRIIPIRNKVMHPRLLDFFDYPTVKECFDCIESLISFVDWISVRQTKILLQSPDELRTPWSLRKSESVIENIPDSVDFEETSFIGRQREIGEIKGKLFRPNVHVLSIIGNGGVGKTAIVIKLLYDLLDDPESKFEVILWSSFKTRELSKFEFSRINDSILSVSQMYERLGEFVGKPESMSANDYLIELSKKFKILLVLDNLETINSSEIRDFVDDFTANGGKILITSRIGLGEIEHRYKLEGMNEEDLHKYFSALLELYGLNHIYTTEEKLSLAQSKLYSNPLAIKWFVRGLNSGLTEHEILEHKEDVINFCMSDVYDKFSPTSKEILNMIILNKQDLSYAEILFYMEYDKDDLEIRKAINELIKCDFISFEKFDAKKTLSIKDFALDFLSNEKIVSLSSFTDKRNKMRGFAQEITNHTIQNPFSVKCITSFNGDITRIIAAYYLCESIKISDKEGSIAALKKVEFAKKIAPDYFECYKFAGYLYAKIDASRAKDEYETSLSLCRDDHEKFYVRAQYAGFLIQANECSDALEQLELAEKSDNSNFFIKLEKAKIYSLVEQFDDAYATMSEVKIDDLSSELRDEFLARKSIILIRQTSLIDQRNYLHKFEIIQEAFMTIEKTEKKTYNTYDLISKILCEMCYLEFYPEAISWVFEKMVTYNIQIRKTKNYNALKKRILMIGDRDPTIRCKFKNFFIDYREMGKELDSHLGIVYELKNGFGFAANAWYPNGIFFAFSNNPEVEIGDIIQFEKITITERGPVVSKFIVSKKQTIFIPQTNDCI